MYRKVVTRRSCADIKERGELNRYVAAFTQMMKNGSFVHWAKIHGYNDEQFTTTDGLNCTHRIQSFGAWHRIYLFGFEGALQRADKENGNDGSIGLPYWEWEENSKLPELLRALNKYPPGMLDDLVIPRKRFRKNGPRRYKLSKIRNRTKTLRNKIYKALKKNEHHDSFGSFGKTGVKGHTGKLESVHNGVHNAAGPTMKSGKWAPFDPIFWLHHCNIDRMYELYLQINTINGVSEALLQYKSTERNKGRINDYTFPLPGLTYVENGKTKNYFPRKAFAPNEGRFTNISNTEHLFYTYELPFPGHFKIAGQPQALLKKRTIAPIVPEGDRSYVCFDGVNILSFDGNSYDIYIYIVANSAIADFNGPKSADDIDQHMEDSIPEFAGIESFFGGGKKCANCVKHPLTQFSVEITECLERQNLNPYGVTVFPYFVHFDDDTDKDVFSTLQDMKNGDVEFPDPYIKAPIFLQRNLSQNLLETPNDYETANLQRYLQRFGHYPVNAPITGKYDNITQDAVRSWQKFATGKLENSGVFGQNDKIFATSVKRCAVPDITVVEEKTDDDVKEQKKNYLTRSNKNVKFFVGWSPGYLDYKVVRYVIQCAFDEWSSHSPFTFSLTEVRSIADIVIEWSDSKTTTHKMARTMLHFDGEGGVLAFADVGYIVFDGAERWKYGIVNPLLGLKDDKKQKPLEESKSAEENANSDESTDECAVDCMDPHVLRDKEQRASGKGPHLISLYTTALHEIGHTLGFDHSKEFDEVMGPYYREEVMHLLPGDISKLKEKYGSAGVSVSASSSNGDRVCVEIDLGEFGVVRDMQQKIQSLAEEMKELKQMISNNGS